MKNKWTRASACMLSLMMLVGVLAGCSGNGGSSEGTSAATTAATSAGTSSAATSSASTAPVSTEGMTPEEILESGDLIAADPNIQWPLVTSPITVSIMKPYVTYDTDYKDLAILKEYAEKTGVNVEWNTPPSADFAEKYTLAVNTNDVPDAIIGAPSKIEDYGRDGIFMKLNDLIDNDMVNLKAAMEKYPDAKKAITSDDGSVYSLPYIYQFQAGNYVMMVREDLLKKNSLDMPTTTDEWYNVMKVFKEKENMTPLSGYGSAGRGMDSVISLIAAWGVYPVSNEVYVADKMYPYDNKVHYGPIEDRFKEGIEWLKKLNDEGLIDPEVITNDATSFQAKATNNQIGVWRGWLNGDMIVLNTEAASNGKSEDEFFVSEAPIMKGPEGDQIHPWGGSLATNNGMVISADTEYADILAKWADYWYGDIGQTYVYGVKGVTYEIGDDGNPTWTDWALNNPDGKTLNEVRGMVTFGRSTWPTIFQPWCLTAATGAAYVEENRQKYRDPDKMCTNLPVGLSLTEDESKATGKLTDIDTYVSESLVNFITGKTSMDDWDKYVAQVKQMGIDDVTGAYEASYERWQAR